MNFDLREVLVCLVTIMVIAAATVLAVGAAATYSYMLHAPARQQAAYGAVVMASSIDPCVEAFAMRPSTPASDSGLQCPINRETSDRHTERRGLVL